MTRRMKEIAIEKILINFGDPDLLDIDDDDSEDIDVLQDLIETFDQNDSFIRKELTRENTYEIISNNETEIVEPGGDETSEFVVKKIEDFRWRKCPWATPEAHFNSEHTPSCQKTPVKYFLEYYTQDFIDEVILATNQSVMVKNGTSFNLSREEFLKFLSLEIMTGSIGYYRLEMYWKSPTTIPAFAENMERARFHSIRNNLKFSVNETPNVQSSPHNKHVFKKVLHATKRRKPLH